MAFSSCVPTARTRRKVCISSPPNVVQTLRGLFHTVPVVDHVESMDCILGPGVHLFLHFSITLFLSIIFYGVDPETAGSLSRSDVTGFWFGWSISTFVCCQIYR